MNTPRTKPPARWNFFDYISKRTSPDGTYDYAVTNAEFNRYIGEIISKWPHVEEQMVGVFAELLGVYAHKVPMRQVFRSIRSQHTRITIMRNLLEETSLNAQKGIEYDEIIDEFASLNTARNRYAHGMWLTHESGAVFLADSEGEYFFTSSEPKEIKITELEDVLNRMKKFEKRVGSFVREEMIKRAHAQSSSAI